MPKRSSKGPKPDINQIAANIVAATTGKDDVRQAVKGKNPAAVALGRLGGLKGGKARAAKLSSTMRKSIAKKAANARWNKKDAKKARKA